MRLALVVMVAALALPLGTATMVISPRLLSLDVGGFDAAGGRFRLHVEGTLEIFDDFPTPPGLFAWTDAGRARINDAVEVPVKISGHSDLSSAIPNPPQAEYWELYITNYDPQVNLAVFADLVGSEGSFTVGGRGDSGVFAYGPPPVPFDVGMPVIFHGTATFR